MTQLDKARQEIARNKLKMERDRLAKMQKEFERTFLGVMFIPDEFKNRIDNYLKSPHCHLKTKKK